jgi:hypothetical protein
MVPFPSAISFFSRFHTREAVVNVNQKTRLIQALNTFPDSSFSIRPSSRWIILRIGKGEYYEKISLSVMSGNDDFGGVRKLFISNRAADQRTGRMANPKR